MKVHAKRKNIRLLVLLSCIALGILGLCLIGRALQERQRWSAADRTAEPGRASRTWTVDGRDYVARDGLETYLLLGLDKTRADPETPGYLNDQQADFLLLAVVSREEQKVELLQLNRDTMCRINRLGIGGGDAGSFTGQLALAHTFGSGGSDSCLNTVKAVSELLKGVKIDHYFAATMEAVALLNDLVGGVPVEIRDDFSQADPSLVQGEEVLLQGEQALTFVRARGSMADSSNLARMERQQAYIRAFSAQLQRCTEADPDFISKAFLQVSPYVQTDLTASQLQALDRGMEAFTVGPILQPEGEAVKGEEFMEFYADEESLQAILLQLFCTPQ